MTSLSRRPVRPCALCARVVCLCIGVFVFFATPAQSDTIGVGSYNTWRWNGFSWSSPPVKSAPIVPSISWDATGTASLTGIVYFDEKGDGIVDSNDWAISGALVSLSLAGSSSPVMSAYTLSDGSYKFDNLAAGEYSIALNISDSIPHDNYYDPQLTDDNGKPMPYGSYDYEKGLFSDIVLGDRYTGKNYNFCQLAYPASLISKRLLLASDPGIQHPSVTPVPEPNSLALLLVAGLVIGGMARLRRRRIER